MARTAIVFGLLLCGLTFYGLVAAMTKSPFHFVPLMFGIPVLFCGVVGLNPHRRRVSAGISAGIMGFGTIVGMIATSRFVMHGSDQQPLRPVLLLMGVLMAAMCFVFVAVFIFRTTTDRRRRLAKNLSNPGTGTVKLASADNAYKLPNSSMEPIDPQPQTVAPSPRGD